MDEEKLRKALQIFFKEYAKITEKINELSEGLKKQAPVEKSEIPRALEIFNEEIESADLPMEIKIILPTLVNKALEGVPDYVS